jgi:REP element-mobilizing transposase RayT
MPFWRTCYHLVWATKNREPLITEQVEPRLYGYLARKAAELDAVVHAINGSNDRVHLIASIPPHVSVSQFVKLLKGASSHDLNQQGLDVRFAWQRGYGVLTLGQKQRAGAEAYVWGQKEHHQQRTTIAWLERSADVDEAPPECSLRADPPVPAIREAGADYEALGEPAF